MPEIACFVNGKGNSNFDRAVCASRGVSVEPRRLPGIRKL